jgi:hypothetical protein
VTDNIFGRDRWIGVRLDAEVGWSVVTDLDADPRRRRNSGESYAHLEQNPVKDIHAQEIRVDSILDALQLVCCMLDQC